MAPKPPAAWRGAGVASSHCRPHSRPRPALKTEQGSHSRACAPRCLAPSARPRTRPAPPRTHVRSQHAHAHARGSIRALPSSGRGRRRSSGLHFPTCPAATLAVAEEEGRRAAANWRRRGPAARTHARTRAHPWLRPRRPRAGARPGVRRAAARARGRAVTVGAEGRRQRGSRRCADPGRGCGEGAGASDLPEAGASQGARTSSAFAAAAAMNNSGADEIG